VTKQQQSEFQEKKPFFPFYHTVRLIVKRSLKNTMG
jgi:hypothetical protein